MQRRAAWGRDCLITQNTQWLLLLGVSFVVSAYLQVVRHYDAIQTRMIFTPATAGLLASSLAARAPRQAVPAADPHPGRLPRHHRRRRRPADPVTGISSPAPGSSHPGCS